MPRPETETRWAAYWEAVRAGYSDRESYDRYLHPRMRVPLAQVIHEHPHAADDPQG